MFRTNEWSASLIVKENIRRAFLLEDIEECPRSVDFLQQFFHSDVVDPLVMVDSLASILKIDFGCATRICSRSGVFSGLEVAPMERGIQFKNYPLNIQRGAKESFVRMVQAYSYSHALRGGFSAKHNISDADIDARVTEDIGRSIIEFMNRELGVKFLSGGHKIKFDLPYASLVSDHSIRLLGGGSLPVFFMYGAPSSAEAKVFTQANDRALLDLVSRNGCPAVVIYTSSAIFSPAELVSGYLVCGSGFSAFGFSSDWLSRGVSYELLSGGPGKGLSPDEMQSIIGVQESYATGIWSD